MKFTVFFQTPLILALILSRLLVFAEISDDNENTVNVYEFTYVARNPFAPELLKNTLNLSGYEDLRGLLTFFQYMRDGDTDDGVVYAAKNLSRCKGGPKTPNHIWLANFPITVSGGGTKWENTTNWSAVAFPETIPEDTLNCITWSEENVIGKFPIKPTSIKVKMKEKWVTLLKMDTVCVGKLYSMLPDTVIVNTAGKFTLKINSSHSLADLREKWMHHPIQSSQCNRSNVD